MSVASAIFSFRRAGSISPVLLLIVLLLFTTHVSGFDLINGDDSVGYYLENGQQLLPRDRDTPSASTSGDGDGDQDDTPLLIVPSAIAEPPSKTISSIATPTKITENSAIQYVLKAGEYHVYELSNVTNATSLLDRVYLTANLCGLPDADDTGSHVQIQIAPSLDMLTAPYADMANYSFISLNTSGVWKSYGVALFDEEIESWYTYFYKGFANITTYKTNSSSMYFLIQAPETSQYGAGVDPGSTVVPSSNDTWTYQVGISTSRPMHEFSSDPNLYLVDSDFAHSLFTTSSMVSSFTLNSDGRTIATDYQNQTFYKNQRNYYNIHVFSNAQGQRFESRLGASFCAITDSTEQLLNRGNADVSISTRGDMGMPKLQYFVNGLNISSEYVIFLSEARDHGNDSSTSLTGGVAFPAVQFQTNQESNCQIIYNLDFCSDVAYAVPGNASSFTPDQLRDVYDAQAVDWYRNFNYSLQQVPCDAHVIEQYSIFRDCLDCRTSYRQWLCSVTIPRCKDSVDPEPYLAVRDVNQSRAAFIDSQIRPGPYKELLPCIDLCQALVQDCPASFDFTCPRAGHEGFDGYYMTKATDGSVQCNYPGVVYRKSLGVGMLQRLEMAWVYAAQIAVLSYLFLV